VNASIFLAKLMGPLFLLVGTGLFLNANTLRAIADEVALSRAIVYLLGLITFTAGLAIVLTHNVWVVGWPVLITISGWLALINGVVRLLTPQDAVKFARKVYRQPHGALTTALVWIVTGAVLSFFGYFSELLGVNP